MKKIKKNMPQEILEEILSYSTADTQFIDNIKNKIPWWVDQNRYSVTGYLSLTREERETFLLEKFGSADRKYVFSSNWILGFPTNFTEAVAFFRKSLNHEKYNVAAVQPFWKAVSGVPRTIQKLREIVNSQKPPLTDEERLKEIGKFFSEKPYLKDPTSKTVYLQRLYRLIEKILQFVSVSPHNSPAPKI